MNDSATKLLEQLGGIGSTDEAAEQSSELLLGSLSPDSDDLDRWHLLMVELAYVLNASFQDVHYWEGVESKQDTLLQFVRTMHRLDRMKGHDKTVRIKYRGSHLTGLPANLDYIIQFGKLVLDYNVVSELIKRQGLRFKHFEGRIKKAFGAFEEQGISSVSLKIPGRSHRALETMKICLRIFSCFNQAVETLTPITFDKNGKQCALPPIPNEYDQPDPNLTLVAALNSLDETKMQGLVRKVASLAGGDPDGYSEDQFSNVYQTFFKVKSLRNKLSKPPLEVNSNSTLARFMSQGETAPDKLMTEEFDSASAQHADRQIDPETLKTGVAQFAKATFKGSIQHAKLAMKSVFAQDYNQVNLKVIGQRFKLLSQLLYAMEKNPRGQQILDEVLKKLQASIDQVPQEMLDDLVVKDNVVKFWSGGKEVVIGETDDNLLDVIETSKEQSIDRRKSAADFSPYERLEYEDYQNLAERFGITVVDAEQIVSLFENCFDKQNTFQRTTFTSNVPDFMRFGNHIFEILWCFLKETPERKDRLPFLNSLQFLVKETQEPLKAIKILLSDFILNSSGISFPDRNAIMLANQFLRTYNKEANMDIEITPEEVLLVKVGLDQKLANYASWRVDGEQRKFLQKIIMIRKRLIEALEAFEGDDSPLPIRFLLALEREVHILLALVGGETASMVLRSALKVYGNPDAQVYRMKESKNHMTSLIQHLAALIRGIGRVGSMDDLPFLDEIKQYREGFLDLNPKDQRHEALIRRIMGWIDLAKNEISSRSSQTATPGRAAAAGQRPVPNTTTRAPNVGINTQPG